MSLEAEASSRLYRLFGLSGPGGCSDGEPLASDSSGLL